MKDHYHPDVWLELGKARMREFHREQELANLVREARKSRPGRIKMLLDQVERLFTLLAGNLRKRFRIGRKQREKATVVRNQPSLRANQE